MSIPIDPSSLLTGVPFGTVWPPKPPPRGLPDKDAREHALKQFKLFVSLLVFNRPGNINEPPIPFKVPEDSIHIYQPDDVKTAELAGIGILPGRGVHQEYGLGPAVVLEDTVDVFGQGTVLVRESEYTEVFTIEIVAAKHAERTAIAAGLKEVLRYADDSYAIRLRLPGYYNQVASFSLNESMPIDDDHAVRNRRRAHLYVELTVPEVFLVWYRLLQPRIDLEVEDGGVIALELLASRPEPET